MKYFNRLEERQKKLELATKKNDSNSKKIQNTEKIQIENEKEKEENTGNSKIVESKYSENSFSLNEVDIDCKKDYFEQYYLDLIIKQLEIIINSKTKDILFNLNSKKNNNNKNNQKKNQRSKKSMKVKMKAMKEKITIKFY